MQSVERDRADDPEALGRALREVIGLTARMRTEQRVAIVARIDQRDHLAKPGLAQRAVPALGRIEPVGGKHAGIASVASALPHDRSIRPARVEIARQDQLGVPDAIQKQPGASTREQSAADELRCQLTAARHGIAVRAVARHEGPRASSRAMAAPDPPSFAPASAMPSCSGLV